MVFEWKDSLSVGVEEIDDQHKELIKRVDDLATSIQKNKGRDRIFHLLNFMEDYTEFHFQSEEKYMERFDYPGTDDHRGEHLRFMDVVARLKGKFKEKGRREDFAMEIQQFLIDWLILHIQNTDSEMGAFLKEKVDE